MATGIEPDNSRTVATFANNHMIDIIGGGSKEVLCSNLILRAIQRRSHYSGLENPEVPRRRTHGITSTALKIVNEPSSTTWKERQIYATMGWS
jgi:hypothetical protein